MLKFYLTRRTVLKTRTDKNMCLSSNWFWTSTNRFFKFNPNLFNPLTALRKCAPLLVELLLCLTPIFYDLILPMFNLLVLLYLHFASTPNLSLIMNLLTCLPLTLELLILSCATRINFRKPYYHFFPYWEWQLYFCFPGRKNLPKLTRWKSWMFSDRKFWFQEIKGCSELKSRSMEMMQMMKAET